LIFVLDECVDQPVADRLRSDGHEVLCASEMAPGAPDEAVLSLANARDAVLITSDKDFGELVYRRNRVTRGVLLIRLAGLSPGAKAEVVSAAVRRHGVEMPWAFSVVSPGRALVGTRLRPAANAAGSSPGTPSHLRPSVAASPACGQNVPGLVACRSFAWRSP